jgi:hypothetical protein
LDKVKEFEKLISRADIKSLFGYGYEKGLSLRCRPLEKIKTMSATIKPLKTLKLQ